MNFIYSSAINHDISKVMGYLGDSLGAWNCLCVRVGAHVGVAGVGVVKHTLAEPEDYLLHVILSGAYLCDVALNDVLCDNRQDFHVLGAT
jgi:hypothetical protein